MRTLQEVKVHDEFLHNFMRKEFRKIPQSDIEESSNSDDESLGMIYFISNDGIRGISDGVWFETIGMRSALRWLMGKEWDEGIDIQALENFFEDPEKYFNDERILEFVKKFM